VEAACAALETELHKWVDANAIVSMTAEGSNVVLSPRGVPRTARAKANGQEYHVYLTQEKHGVDDLIEFTASVSGIKRRKK
jgi:hypothetical protein